MDFTSLIFQGRLTDDPVLRTASNGTVLCKFDVASNRRINKDEERTTYIPVTVFGKQAPICAEFLTKGREVHVTGEFETDSYTDNDGIKRKGFGCIARDVRFGRGGTRQDQDQETETAKETNFDSLDKDTKARALEMLRASRGR